MPPPPHPPAPEASSRLIVGARLVAVAAAAIAVVSAVVLARSRQRAAATVEAAYVCPMHREVVSAAPGACPICGMPLAPGAGLRPSVAVLPARLQRGAIEVARRRQFSQELRAPAWVDARGSVRALVYDDELGGLGPVAWFESSSDPGVRAGLARSADPPLRWDSATMQIGFRFDGGPPAAAGATGWVVAPAGVRELLVVPASAVLQSPGGPYVLAMTTDRRALRKRPVRIGKVFNGLAAVVEGLGEGEAVAARGAFFLDAELRLRGNADEALPVAP